MVETAPPSEPKPERYVRRPPGTVIEISDISGSKGRFFEKIKLAAANWDGSDPVRVVG